MNLEQGDANFSPCRRYRYSLTRWWGEGPAMLFIGLNPSTADEKKLDPTLRRVIGFARREGCGSVWMGNLFALRSTDPSVLARAEEPVGPENDQALWNMANLCDIIVCGWGNHGVLNGRSTAVGKLLQDFDLQCLGRTFLGQPKHPLYLKADTPLLGFDDLF